MCSFARHVGMLPIISALRSTTDKISSHDILYLSAVIVAPKGTCNSDWALLSVDKYSMS